MTLISLSEVTTYLLKDCYRNILQIQKLITGQKKIEQYGIKFKYIKGIKNTLADTMNRLIAINPDMSRFGT